MIWLRVAIILLVAVLLQVTIVPALDVRGARPDLLLLAAACMAAREHARGGRRWRAFWIGWAAGLLADVYAVGSSAPFGLTALAFGLVAILVSKMGEDLFVESCVAQWLIFAPVCVGAHGLLALARAALGGPALGIGLRAALGTGLYSGLVAPLVFAALKPFTRRFGTYPREGLRRA